MKMYLTDRYRPDSSADCELCRRIQWRIQFRGGAESHQRVSSLFEPFNWIKFSENPIRLMAINRALNTNGRHEPHFFWALRNSCPDRSQMASASGGAKFERSMPFDLPLFHQHSSRLIFSNFLCLSTGLIFSTDI